MTPTFRTMDRADLDRALDWARAEGWNPGQDDAAAFFATDPEGFFVAEVAGQPVASISVVNHSDAFAFLGLYICLPEFRGQGVGHALWKHALAHAGDRLVGLDGVPDQQENYKKSGFVLTGQTYRFAGEVMGETAPGIRGVMAEDLDVLIEMEAVANGYAKPAFLAHWLTDTPTRRTLVLDQGGPVGCATLRACAVGTKIGPVVAGSPEEAEALILSAAAEAREGDVIVDVPDDCPALIGFCEGLGMTVSFNTARMYRGAPPLSGATPRTIATLELG